VSGFILADIRWGGRLGMYGWVWMGVFDEAGVVVGGVVEMGWAGAGTGRGR
jgi:hypothetical protein